MLDNDSRSAMCLRSDALSAIHGNQCSETSAAKPVQLNQCGKDERDAGGKPVLVF
jgi:hypothetical protein